MTIRIERRCRNCGKWSLGLMQHNWCAFCGKAPEPDHFPWTPVIWGTIVIGFLIALWNIT